MAAKRLGQHTLYIITATTEIDPSFDAYDGEWSNLVRTFQSPKVRSVIPGDKDLAAATMKQFMLSTLERTFNNFTFDQKGFDEKLQAEEDQDDNRMQDIQANTKTNWNQNSKDWYNMMEQCTCESDLLVKTYKKISGCILKKLNWIIPQYLMETSTIKVEYSNQ